MCIMLYIAAKEPLPLIEWNEEKPAFYVVKLSEDEQRVKKQFSTNYVYYIGSHQGCGCGFYHELLSSEDQEDFQEYLSSKQSMQNLYLYLLQQLETQEKLELFSCWDGDQEAIPEYYQIITIDYIKDKAFKLKEKELLLLKRINN